MPLREGAEQVGQEISLGVGDKGKEGGAAMTTTDIEALVVLARDRADMLSANDYSSGLIGRLADALERQQAVVEAARKKFERIIQVRAGHGMLEGREALDEMARLAGEALAALDAPPSEITP